MLRSHHCCVWCADVQSAIVAAAYILAKGKEHMKPHTLPVVWLLLCSLLCVHASSQTRQHSTTTSAPKVRTYYLSAEEIDWDYTPNGMDVMMGKDFDGYSKIFTEHKADRIGRTYRKAVFFEYIYGTYPTRKPRPPELAHMGLLGPVIRAEVGDTIKVVLRNQTSFPFSLHPHGVAYVRDSEGAMYGDGMERPEADGLVPPGKTHTYTWLVRKEAGPGPGDGSSIAWLYHSHNFEPKDVNAGLIGAIVITRRGMARPDGSPVDIAREFFSLFMIIDENQSRYFGHNVQSHIADPAKVNLGEFIPVDPEGNGDLPLGTGFGISNMKSTINGYLFSNGPLIT